MRKIDIEELRRLAGEGWYTRKLAKHFGVQDNAITGACRRHGIAVARCNWLKIDPEKLAEMLQQRRTYDDIAAELGVTRWAVSQYISRHHPNYRPNRVRLQHQDIVRMRRMLGNGVNSTDIAEFFGVERGSVFNAVTRLFGGGRRSTYMVTGGKHGRRIPDDKIGSYSEVIRKLLYRRYPNNWEQVDAGVAFASVVMQEHPEVKGWKTLYAVTAQRQTVEEIRTALGRYGQKVGIRNAESLAVDIGVNADTPDDTAEYLREKIGELEEKYSALLYTLLDSGFNHGEAMRKLDLPESTYFARYTHARKALREILPDELESTISER